LEWNIIHAVIIASRAYTSPESGTSLSNIITYIERVKVRNIVRVVAARPPALVGKASLNDQWIKIEGVGNVKVLGTVSCNSPNVRGNIGMRTGRFM
jgi:hypothetical protein